MTLLKVNKPYFVLNKTKNSYLKVATNVVTFLNEVKF